MFVLYFEDEEGKNYSVCLDLDWLEDHVLKSWIDVDSFLNNYTSKDVFEIVDAMDAENIPYTIREEHHFSGFAD